MLSRSTSAAVKSNARSILKTVTVSNTSVDFKRYNSTEAAQEKGSNSAKAKTFKKPFYNTFTDFIKTNKINENGEFITERPGEQDYEQSELAKYLKSVNAKKETLIEEKLQALAEINNVKYEDLKKKFEQKVNEKTNLIKAQHSQVLDKIEKFTSQLALPSSGRETLLTELVEGLIPFCENLNESAAYAFLLQLDPTFAKALGNAIRITPTQESVNAMAEAFKSGSIAQISDSDYAELKNLLSSDKAVETPAKEGEAAEIEEQPIDGLTVLETIFSNLNSYENINNSPLLKLIEKVDGEFATLLKSYETIDPSNEEALKAKYEEILDYCSNKESKVFKAFGDSNSPDFSKVKEVLGQPLPIDLSELYEIFEFYPDYFTSDLFKSIEKIDPEFAKLLNDLETLPEGKELDDKNVEIDAYLSNDMTPIYIAMNDVTSESFKALRAVLDSEWTKMESTVTPDKLLEYSIQNGLDSDGFKLISKIDPTFAELISKLYNEKNEDKAMEIYASLQEYLGNENDIVGALADKESLNYKLLSDYVFAEPNEIVESESLKEEAVTEVSSENIDTELAELLKEDQSKNPSEVAEINEVYDLAIDVLNEIESELKNNTFISVSRQVSNKLDKLLGFQPSAEQVTDSEVLKSKPLPKQTDEVLELAVNIIMKDGKKEIARKHLNRALYLLFLETRSNPVEKLKEALDIVAPVVITKTVKTGFAKNFTVPVPLTQRQRNRMALLWILKSCDSKASNDFSVRLCDELMHVLGGKSALMDKRVLSHKMAIANRSYLSI